MEVSSRGDWLTLWAAAHEERCHALHGYGMPYRYVLPVHITYLYLVDVHNLHIHSIMLIVCMHGGNLVTNAVVLLQALTRYYYNVPVVFWWGHYQVYQFCSTHVQVLMQH